MSQSVEQKALQAAKSTAPSTSILNPAFEYTPSKHMGADYLREKFARIKAAQTQPTKVTHIKRRKA